MFATVPISNNSPIRSKSCESNYWRLSMSPSLNRAIMTNIMQLVAYFDVW